jgi:pyruvate,orthophosphate dikinase
MFFDSDRINIMRGMILASSEEERRMALDQLLPLQRQDFIGIFREMGERPVTIRTLDPPLHEFLPQEEKIIVWYAQQTGTDEAKIRDALDKLHESNPMLGHRGCRLGITYPEITEMQARAIMEAACTVKKEGVDVRPEIMIPLVGHVNELIHQESIVRKVADEIIEREGQNVSYLVGTMIELPRSAITADRVAECAQFFSFGTNDLTQTTFGLSRDDSGRFLPSYVDKSILRIDPFQAIDREGIGYLMRLAVEKGRRTRPGLKVGICGEHGGEPTSVEFCHAIDLDYVSCSPYRIPVALLAAAQAAMKERMGELDVDGDVGAMTRMW